MKSDNAKYAMMCLGAFVPVFATLLFTVLTFRNIGFNTQEFFWVLMLAFGIGIGCLVSYSLMQSAYIVQAFVLHGWNNSEYAIFLRVYGEGVVKAHSDRKIFKVPQGTTLPGSPRWATVKDSPTSVIVCGQEYKSQPNK